jgi:hypothetical protein
LVVIGWWHAMFCLIVACRMQQQKSEQGTMDWCGSVQHGCQVIQTLPAPQQGRVKTSNGNFIQNQGFAQMAKHVAPHVSIDLPEGMDHDLEDGHHHQFLKGELEQLDASIGAPPFFAYEFVELPPQLHQTAFARELHDTFVKFTMNLNDPRCVEEMQCGLLRGAGCSVELDGKCAVRDAESTQRCAKRHSTWCCSRQCQLGHWKLHKGACNKQSKA